jgi:hypothetical protein
MGYGIVVFRETKTLDFLSQYYALGALLILAGLKLLDSHLWTSPRLLAAKRCSFGAVLFLAALSILFSAGKHPYGPISMYALGFPVWLAVAKTVLLNAKFSLFVTWLPGPLFLLSLSIFAYWIHWTWSGATGQELSGAGTNEWSIDVRNRYAQDIRCQPNFADYPECESLYDKATHEWRTDLRHTCTEVYDTCLDAFFIWAMPLFVSLYLFFLSHMSVYVKIDDLNAAPQGFSRLIMLLVFGLWCAASLSASNAGVTNAFMAFLLFAGLSVAVVFIFVHSRKSAEERLLDPFLQAMQERFAMHADWIRGATVLLGGPIALGYYVLSFCIQMVRLTGFNKLVNPMPVEHRNYWVTKTAYGQYRSVCGWRWTSVLQKSLWIGVVIQCFSVLITKFTYLFLAWLKVEVKTMTLGSVTVIMIVIGLLLFLFPPIPGVPVYFTAGIILVAAGEQELGLPMAITYACVVSLLLKLLACACQQKLIGSPMKNKVGIRQAVGVNSNLMRTTKLVLSKPGLSAVKIAILVGGPDWPTSVLTGILDLPLLPCLIGTLPVVVIIVPTVLSGSFVYLAEKYTWAGTASAISTSLTGLVIMAMPMMTMYHIERAMEENKDELARMPLDKEVLRADENEEQRRLLYLELTKWQVLPRWLKSVLIVGNMFMFMSCYLALAAGGACFREFTMSDSIETDLGGDPWSLIKFLGWVSIVGFCVGSFCLWLFSSWATKTTNDAMKSLFIVGARESASKNIARMEGEGGGSETKPKPKPMKPGYSLARDLGYTKGGSGNDDVHEDVEIGNRQSSGGNPMLAGVTEEDE